MIVPLLVSLTLLAPWPAGAAADTPDPSVAPPPRVFGVGDSVMLGAAAALSQAIDGVEIDAVVGRQADTGIDIVRARAAASQLGDVVIFDLGTNGPLSAQQLDDLMGMLAGVRRVVLVTLRVPRAWEASNNALLVAAAQRSPNTVVADWHTASLASPDLLWDDGIHLRPAGAEAYAALVAPLATAPLP